MSPDTPSSSPSGLSESEAAARLKHEGYNELPQQRRRTLFHIALEVLREPMFQLLVAAGLIYLTLGDRGEASMLLGFVAITVTISIAQERRTETVLEALRDLTSPRALVIRDGRRKRIAGREVVRGDLLILAEGDRIHADAVLLSANQLQTDESLLTGESAPVRKRERAGAPVAARPGGDDLPLVFAGTLVVRGQGTAEVVVTGERSEIGKIGKSLGAIESEPTPLHAETRRLVRLFATIGVSLSLVVVFLYGLTRGAWLDGVLAGITLAMAMLPEEFPLILTVFMVMGAWRISRERVLTRRSATIETLGAATVLCTDKTGTLTENRMAVAEINVDGAIWTAAERTLAEPFHALLEYGILASERDPFDPMEKAFHALGQRFLIGTEHLHHTWVLAHEYGLSPDMLAMSHVWKAIDRPHYIIAAKGAPEAIADLCHMPLDRLQALRSAADQMASRGMRVLGVASAAYEGDAWPGSQHDFDFRFLGLAGLVDPLRATVPAAVAECQSAGVNLVMITGDYPATARAVAIEAGLRDSGNVLTGDDLAQLSDAELQTRIADTTVFARIMPEQKLRIVDGYKARGEIVAMTGDGVNDAPSLKAAHIGIAMGERGTDVAREAASLVLLDDDFGSIVKAVRLGRRIFDNLRKAMAFIVAVHIPIAGLSLLPLLLGLPLIFTPVHIAFLQLVIDPVCAIVFEAEPEEENVMRRPPRHRATPLFTAALMAWSTAQGLCVLLSVGAFYLTTLHLGFGEAVSRAAAFVALVACDFGLVLVNRTSTASLAATLRRPNRAFWQILATATVLLAVAFAVPALRAIFRFALPPLPILAAAIALGIAVILVLESIKAVADTARRQHAA